MKTAFDIIRRQNEAEAEVWKHFPAIEAAMAAVYTRVAQVLVTEGFVAVLDGEIADIRAPSIQADDTP